MKSDLFVNSVGALHRLLFLCGVPSSIHPTPEQVALGIWCTAFTLVAYYNLFGRRHDFRRRRLAKDLQMAASRVHALEEKLLRISAEQIHDKNSGKPIRIFMDGAFDMMHYGHMNAFRQGRSLGTHLLVGVNSDESITKCKGAPVMNDQERLTAVEGCKFVDEVSKKIQEKKVQIINSNDARSLARPPARRQVIPGCPYVMNAEYLDYVIKKYKVDYVVHGDDPCIVDGKDVYATAKKTGRYQSIPRTEGVSTTDIVGRMLLMTKDHHKAQKGGLVSSTEAESEDSSEEEECEILGNYSKFLTTSRMLRLFSAGVKAPDDGMSIIYIDGSWDMFHAGHISILEKAKKRGDYVIVGVHSDAVINKHLGSNLPIMNLHERVLSVLGCKYVDDVLIDAPYTITPEMIASLKITEVVRGSATAIPTDERLRYKHAMDCGIYKVIESPSDFSLKHIFERIQRNQERFKAKIEKKKEKEDEYYNEKYAKTKNWAAKVKANGNGNGNGKSQ